jgi:hypothetical protein
MNLRKFAQAAQTLSYYNTKFTKDLEIITSYLRALRDLRGEISVSHLVAAQPRWDLRGEIEL